MSAKSKSTSCSNVQNFHDPSTFIQRPTSAKTPDVAHILTNIFGEIFTKDVLSTEVIKNLTISADVDDPYHKRYVQRLRDAQLVKENRFQEYAMLEKHILEARAKAMAYEDRENNKRNNICEDPDAFGVPPVKSYFSHCLNDALMREKGLLAPSDYYSRVKTPIHSAPKQKTETYKRETIASGARSWRTTSASTKPAKSDFFDEIEDFHKAGSDNEATLSSDEENMVPNKKQPFWKETLRQVQRESAKNELKKIDDRVRYLPNPRLDAIRNGQLSNIPQNVLEISPECISFVKYSIGKVYESTFKIRNISKIAHQVRALPPKTQFFSLSLGQYPHGQSVIAPGLSASFNVRFAPDSLCTFEDEILVECSNGLSVKVPLVAKRESPSLSIGSQIDCGQALVGQIKVCRYVVQNEGGDGRFVILPKSNWPGSTFKTNVSSANNLALYPFEVQPSIFEIPKGGQIALEIIFKPPDVKRYEQTIIMTCDNCTTIEFKLVGEGELAECEYIQQEEDLADSMTESTMLIDEYKDIMSNRVIRFPSLNPNVYTRKRFAIKNKSAASLDYSWLIYKPVFEDNLMQENNEKKFSYVIDKEAYFSIAPKQGTLDRHDTKVFEIMFSPSKVGSYNSVAHFVLHGIPEVNKQLMINSSTQNKEITTVKSSLTKDDMIISDFVSTVIELKGDCEAFQFTLDPPAVYIPGATYMHTTQRKAFRLINMSICPINFNWKQVLGPHVIQVEPSYGEIAPKSYALMDALITGTRPGKLVDDIPCYIEFAEEPIYLHVEADIKGPEAIIQEAGLDFGLVQIGDISKSYITIENISNLPLKWNLSCTYYAELFEFPPEGNLQPLEAVRVEITFTPKAELILKTQFEFVIEDGNTIACNCVAQVQKANASFLDSQVTVDALYLNVEDIAIARLCNHSVLETRFKFGNPEGPGVDSCKVRVEPMEGILMGKSVLDIKIYLTCDKLGDLDELRLPCYVKDMEYPIFVELKGIVKGVSINYFSSDTNDPNDLDYQRQLISNESKIDFGTACVGSPSERSLIVQNNSGIKTRVRLEIKRFKTVPKPDNKHALINDPIAKTNQLSDRYQLVDKTNGIGFVINTPEFDLPAFGSIKCTLTTLSEVWGEYSDFLYINCKGKIDTDCLHLEANVTGSPVRFFSGKVVDNGEEIAMIRFGSLTQDTGVIKRSLKIQNMSSMPIQIDWRVFVVEENDKRLIDLNVVYDDINEADLMRIAGVQQISNSTSNKRSNNSTISNWKSSEQSMNYGKFIEPGIERGSNTSMDYYDSNVGYVYVEQLPLIKLNITPHYGVELDDKNAVFYLNNTRTILKPREKTALEVCFTSGVQSRNYEAIFVGYLNIHPNYQKFDGCQRKVSFEKEPIRFKATGQVEIPSLDIEFNDELHFDVAIGDLIDNQASIVDQKLLRNQFTLLNSSLAPIEFNLRVSEPFYFNEFINHTARHTLRPKEKLKVDVLFKFNAAFIKQIDFSESKKILLEDSIVVEYTGGGEQEVPISARILAPELVTTKELIEFGTCLVGQERVQQLLIRNPSSSALFWRLNIKNNEGNSFVCDKTEGFMDSNKYFITNTEQAINVKFTARHNEVYKSQLVIDIEPSFGILQPLVIELTGSGTYDQSAEAVLNI